MYLRESSPNPRLQFEIGSAQYSIDGKPFNGICPSCGFEKDHAAARYCGLCTLAHHQETVQAIVRRAVAGRPANEDRLRGVR